MAIAADAQATLPFLIEACKRLIAADRRRALDERGKRIAAANQQSLERVRADATLCLGCDPDQRARVWAEMWAVVKNKDWASSEVPDRVCGTSTSSIRRSAAAVRGSGFGLPTAVGAALAHKKYGRLCIGLQNDGDMMYAPGALWTAAHHRIPMLLVMHNNRAYHQEMMHIQRMANRRQRGITNAGIGTKIEDPNIDYAMLARSMGVYGEGPITDPRTWLLPFSEPSPASSAAKLRSSTWSRNRDRNLQ